MFIDNKKSSSINIELAQREDLTEILQLQKRAFLTEAEAHGNYEIEPLKQTYESILMDFDTHSFLKAVNMNKIIGSVRYKKINDVIWIGKLIVDLEYRGQGLGKKLLTEVEEINSTSVKFQLFTAVSSIWNIRLYESVGYKVHREYNDEKQNGIGMVEMLKFK